MVKLGKEFEWLGDTQVLQHTEEESEGKMDEWINEMEWPEESALYSKV